LELLHCENQRIEAARCEVGRELRISLGHQHTVVDAHAVGGITLFDPNEDSREVAELLVVRHFFHDHEVLSPM